MTVEIPLKRYVAEMVFELGTPGSAVRRATDYTTEPGIYPKYWDTFSPYHNAEQVHFTNCWCVQNTAGWVANIVDPDQTPQSAASDLGLHRLLGRVCPNTLNTVPLFCHSGRVKPKSAFEYV